MDKKLMCGSYSTQQPLCTEVPTWNHTTLQKVAKTSPVLPKNVQRGSNSLHTYRSNKPDELLHVYSLWSSGNIVHTDSMLSELRLEERPPKTLLSHVHCNGGVGRQKKSQFTTLHFMAICWVGRERLRVLLITEWVRKVSRAIASSWSQFFSAA